MRLRISLIILMCETPLEFLFKKRHFWCISTRKQIVLVLTNSPSCLSRQCPLINKHIKGSRRRSNQVLKTMCCLASGASYKKTQMDPSLCSHQTKWKYTSCKITFFLFSVHNLLWVFLGVCQLSEEETVTADVFQPGTRGSSVVHLQPVTVLTVCSSVWNANSQAGCGHTLRSDLLTLRYITARQSSLPSCAQEQAVRQAQRVSSLRPVRFYFGFCFFVFN